MTNQRVRDLIAAEARNAEPGGVQDVLETIMDELVRQQDDGKPGPWLDMDVPSDSVIDGRIDLVALASAIVQTRN